MGDSRTRGLFANLLERMARCGYVAVHATEGLHASPPSPESRLPDFPAPHELTEVLEAPPCFKRGSQRNPRMTPATPRPCASDSMVQTLSARGIAVNLARDAAQRRPSDINAALDGACSSQHAQPDVLLWWTASLP